MTNPPPVQIPSKLMDDPELRNFFHTLVQAVYQNWYATNRFIDPTLASLAAYNTNGLLTQTAVDTFTGRTITGTSSRITVTNGNGVSGNPTLDIASTYAGQSTITTLGTISSGVWHGTAITVQYGGTGAATLTGYVKGNGTSALTAAATVPTADITGAALPSHANNAAALGAGLVAGNLYRTGGDPDTVCVVH